MDQKQDYAIIRSTKYQKNYILFKYTLLFILLGETILRNSDYFKKPWQLILYVPVDIWPLEV